MTLFGYIHQAFRCPSAQKGSSSPDLPPIGEITLFQIQTGERVVVKGFSGKLPSERKLHLQAYGLLPGSRIRVTQHTPVFVLQVEHVEIALEAEIARGIYVERNS